MDEELKRGRWEEVNVGGVLEEVKEYRYLGYNIRKAGGPCEEKDN